MDNTPQSQATQADASRPRPLRSGSCVLDRLFESNGLKRGHLCHLYGGHRVVQQQLALLMCKALLERGERALFLNLGEPVEAQMLHRLGLAPFLNEVYNADPDDSLRQRVRQPFRLWRPFAFGEQNPEKRSLVIENLLRKSYWIAATLGIPLTVNRPLTIFVDHLERAFEPSPFESKSHRLSPADAAKSLETLARWLREFPPLAQEAQTTVWLLHSGDEAAPRFGRGTDADTRWLHPLDLSERGELVRREEKRRPPGQPQAMAPSPLQRGVSAMLCGDIQTAKKARAESIAFEDFPQLFGLEVSHPGMMFPTRGFGGTRFALLVQPWQGQGRAGELEQLLLKPTYCFDNNPDRWTPPLRPISTKTRWGVPQFLEARRAIRRKFPLKPRWASV